VETVLSWLKNVPACKLKIRREAAENAGDQVANASSNRRSFFSQNMLDSFAKLIRNVEYGKRP
jgi:hypothetical protein